MIAQWMAQNTSVKNKLAIAEISRTESQSSDFRSIAATSPNKVLNDTLWQRRVGMVDSVPVGSDCPSSAAFMLPANAGFLNGIVDCLGPLEGTKYTAARIAIT